MTRGDALREHPRMNWGGVNTMRWMLAATLVLSWAGSASAQVTECRSALGGIRCETQRDVWGELVRGSDSDAQANARKAEEQALLLEAIRRQAQSSDAASRQVGRRIARGDCQGAVRLALESGELRLAEQAATTCKALGITPQAPPPSQPQ